MLGRGRKSRKPHPLTYITTTFYFFFTKLSGLFAGFSVPFLDKLRPALSKYQTPPWGKELDVVDFSPSGSPRELYSFGVYPDKADTSKKAIMVEEVCHGETGWRKYNGLLGNQRLCEYASQLFCLGVILERLSTQSKLGAPGACPGAYAMTS